MKRMKTALRRFSEEESLPSYEDSHPLETKVQVKMVESFEKSHALQNAVWRGVFSILLFSFVGFFIYSAHRQSVFPWDVVAETRFASHTIILRRLVRVKEALCQMVISNTWGGWKQADIEKAKIVKDLIFSDDFWNRVEYALELTESIMSMLWYADTDEPCLGNIYDAMDSMLEIMKLVIQRREQDPDTLYSKVEKIVLHRWNKMTTPLHLLAYALSPRYYSSEILDIPGRVPPYRDPEVAVGYKRALNRLFSDPDVASNVRREFVSSKNAEPDAINDQSRLDAIGWWYLHGERYMYLQPLAIKILSQKYHAYFMDEVDSETVIIADWLAAVSFLMATVGLLWKTKFHVYWLLCSSAIGLLLACFWMYHMLRLSTFRWDVIWLPLGPLSCGGLCIYVDRLLSEALEDIKRLRASIYHFKRN